MELYVNAYNGTIFEAFYICIYGNLLHTKLSICDLDLDESTTSTQKLIIVDSNLIFNETVGDVQTLHIILLSESLTILYSYSLPAPQWYLVNKYWSPIVCCVLQYDWQRLLGLGYVSLPGVRAPGFVFVSTHLWWHWKCYPGDSLHQ